MIPLYNPPRVEFDHTENFTIWFKRLRDQFPQHHQYTKDFIDQQIKPALDNGVPPVLVSTPPSPYVCAPSGEQCIAVNAPCTVNLPIAKGQGTGVRVIMLNNSGTVTITPNGTDTINGVTSDTINTQYVCHLYRDVLQGTWVKEY